MPFISNTDDVRQEATAVWVEDFPNEEIVKEQEYAYGHLSAQIGAYDATHPQADAIRKLEQLLAAYFVLGHYSQYKEFAETKLALFEKLLTSFKESLTGVEVDVGYNAVVSEYKTPVAAFNEDPLNPDITYHKSTRYYVGLQPREIEQPSNPLMLSNSPDYIITWGQRRYGWGSV